MIKPNNRNKTDQSYSLIFSKLSYVKLYYTNGVRKYFMTSSKGLIVLMKIIGLCIIGIGCVRKATLNATSETDIARRSGHEEIEQVKIEERTKLSTRNKEECTESIYKLINEIKLQYNNEGLKQELNDILKSLENHNIPNLKKVNSVSDCIMCLEGKRKGLLDRCRPWNKMYRLTCCNKNIDKECLLYYLFYLRESDQFTIDILSNTSNGPIIKLCCEDSLRLWTYLKESKQKAEDQEVQKIALEIERKYPDRVVLYDGLFSCPTCCNDFEEGVKVYTCEQCNNKACLNCMAKSEDAAKILKCFFCRQFINLGLLSNTKKYLNKHGLRCCLLVTTPILPLILALPLLL